MTNGKEEMYRENVFLNVHKYNGFKVSAFLN